MAKVQPKGRYELRGFCKNRRGYRPVKGFRLYEDDPHAMAILLWRLEHTDKACGAVGWRYEVVDLKFAKGKLIPLVSYEELIRRAKSFVVSAG
jgi:hypothetical protein